MGGGRMGTKACGMSILGALIKNPLDGETKPWKPWYGYLFLAVLVVSGGLYVYQRMNGGPVVPTYTDPSTVYENAKAALERQQVVSVEEAPVITEEVLSDVAKAALAIIQEAPLPETVDLGVPFMTQAPSGVWDDAHIHASEEASLLMAREFFMPTAPLGSIDDMIADGETVGTPSQLSAVAFAAYIEGYDAALNATVIEDASIDEVKKYLAQTMLVLVPTHGDLLQNPFYIAEGLPQHWIVLRGYDAENFFVNDPGTRRGERYVYAQSTVIEAMLENRVVIVELK
jgi:hypothetical protein